MSNPLRCVLDTSVSIKHFIPDPLSPKVDGLLAHLANPQTEIFVPDLFYIESANTLWKYVRAGRYPAAKVQADLAILKTLPLRAVSTAELMEEAVSIGLTYGISAYDGSYVALSRQVSAPVLTLDGKLVTALASSPYDVRSFNDFSLPPLS
ncbi:type II toxin-antitoxin system VapC family toxin [Kamptonema formosum]|uniref:type II toxin-antitoxin system VapC family toxin n=1 Tax=Kamptonema formosum TaxID=331992 RepID=UPI000476E4C2|nr:type II toxin-antitoxin system VapC family toxin [Oscillatoria sp. PCC 10802]